MTVITGNILCQLVTDNHRLINGQGTEVLLSATSDHLSSQPTKDRRATGSCFAFIGAHHQCGVLMVDAG